MEDSAYTQVLAILLDDDDIRATWSRLAFEKKERLYSKWLALQPSEEPEPEETGSVPTFTTNPVGECYVCGNLTFEPNDVDAPCRMVIRAKVCGGTYIPA